MDYTEALALAVLQGVTEFLPVSSSGHLVAAHELWGRTDAVPDSQALAFEQAYDVFLHAASLLAVLWAFRRAIAALFVPRLQLRALALLGVATVPAGIAGLTLQATFESPSVRTLGVVGAGWIVTGVFLLAAERLARGREAASTPIPASRPLVPDPRPLTLMGALIVGLMQACALLPGISRSGSTLSACLALGMPRIQALEFAFLMAIPVIAGAGAKKALDVARQPPPNWGPILAGCAVCFLVSLGALRLLCVMVQARRLRWFAYYCLPLGVMSLAYAWFRGAGSPSL